VREDEQAPARMPAPSAQLATHTQCARNCVNATDAFICLSPPNYIRVFKGAERWSMAVGCAGLGGDRIVELSTQPLGSLPSITSRSKHSHSYCGASTPCSPQQRACRSCCCRLCLPHLVCTAHLGAHRHSSPCGTTGGHIGLTGQHQRHAANHNGAVHTFRKSIQKL